MKQAVLEFREELIQKRKEKQNKKEAKIVIESDNVKTEGEGEEV